MSLKLIATKFLSVKFITKIFIAIVFTNKMKLLSRKIKSFTYKNFWCMQIFNLLNNINLLFKSKNFWYMQKLLDIATNFKIKNLLFTTKFIAKSINLNL